jgi:predicted GNAT superfamily acetyltransferase
MIAGSRIVEVELPEDIVALRAAAPEIAAQWRISVREALLAAFAEGFRIIGITENGNYVLERKP